jgi:hypothetical protein
MNHREKAIARRLFDLHVELWSRHDDTVQAMRTAMESLERSHRIVGQMLEQVSLLMK